jgi:hypothetical protein
MTLAQLASLMDQHGKAAERQARALRNGRG